MDPLSNNDVVRKMMIRVLNVAKETGQDYAVVAYYLVPYPIQAIAILLFDELFVIIIIAYSFIVLIFSSIRTCSVRCIKGNVFNKC